MVTIRAELTNDYIAITKVNNLAFGQSTEGILVEKLRKNPAFIPELSLVAEHKGNIVGHILLFPVKIKSQARDFPCLALAPMSVVPEYQNRGIGGKLIQAGLRKAGDLGYNSVIVLGHPEYYPRFGFRPASKWNIKTDYDVADEVFMAMELTTEGLKGVSGTVEYPNEFQEAG